MKTVLSLLVLVLAMAIGSYGASNIECFNFGIASCKCEQGWCGPECDYPCNPCPTKQDGEEPHENEILYNGKLTKIPFCVHGNCTWTKAEGPKCHCPPEWKDDHCHTPVGEVAQRCIAYETNHTLENKLNPAVVQYMCDMANERCIPDNIDCMFNVPLTKGSDGKVQCTQPSDSRTPCKCKYPVGWCIPLEPGNNLIKSVAASLNNYIDPIFFTQTH